MLACDFLTHVRASRTISNEQYAQLERLIFGAGTPTAEHLQMLRIISGYLKRPDPRWTDLMRRAVEAAAAQHEPELAKVA